MYYLYYDTNLLKYSGNCRGDDFPFQKIAFSVWENSEFRFKGLSEWKFRLAIDTVHKNSVYKPNKKEIRITNPGTFKESRDQ